MRPKKLRMSTTAAMLTSLGWFLHAGLAAANPAILMGSTICQNQRDAFDYQCPSLRASGHLPIVPVPTLAGALYFSDVQQTPAHAALLDQLEDDWDGTSANPPLYPGGQSYEAFCRAQILADPTGAWVPAFIADVLAQFGAGYLALINTNYGGNPFAVCGQHNHTDCNQSQ